MRFRPLRFRRCRRRSDSRGRCPRRRWGRASPWVLSARVLMTPLKTPSSAFVKTPMLAIPVLLVLSFGAATIAASMAIEVPKVDRPAAQPGARVEDVGDGLFCCARKARAPGRKVRNRHCGKRSKMARSDVALRQDRPWIEAALAWCESDARQRELTGNRNFVTRTDTGR